MPDYGDHEATDDLLQILRHSTAHLLAAAVTELYPGAKYAIGPAIKEPPGFYYDFDFGKPISEADLPAIESRMRKIAQEGRKFEHEVLPRDEAIEEFRKRRQDYKLELINDKVSGDGVSLYRTGDFLDLCLGPHVKSTSELKAFRLQRVSGFLFTMICPHFLASGAQGPQRLRRSALRALVCELASLREFFLVRQS